MKLKDGHSLIIEPDFQVGSTIQVKTTLGLSPLPDGTYQITDGTIFTTKDGYIMTITAPAKKTTNLSTDKKPSRMDQLINIIQQQRNK